MRRTAGCHTDLSHQPRNEVWRALFSFVLRPRSYLKTNLFLSMSIKKALKFLWNVSWSCQKFISQSGKSLACIAPVSDSIPGSLRSLWLATTIISHAIQTFATVDYQRKVKNWNFPIKTDYLKFTKPGDKNNRKAIDLSSIKVIVWWNVRASMQYAWALELRLHGIPAHLAKSDRNCRCEPSQAFAVGKSLSIVPVWLWYMSYITSYLSRKNLPHVCDSHWSRTWGLS